MFPEKLVRYHYMTGDFEMQRRFKINPHWHPESGYFESSLEDFKKFFEQVKKNSEVTRLYLLAGKESGCSKPGVWAWYQNRGWVYYGQ